MRITWIISASKVAEDAGEITSPLASYRYRAAIPMRALRSRGHTCSWHGLSTGESIDAQHPALQATDVAVFGKNHSEQAEVVALLELARARGVATVVDTCDDYFEPGHQNEPYYRALVERADLVTASSHVLAAAIEDATDIPAHVVVDPYEGPGGAPRWSPAGRSIKALWFGTPFNLEPLLDQALELPRKISDYQLDIEVLTQNCDGLEDAFRKLNERNAGKLALHFREWSLERNWAGLAACDLAVIPIKQSARFFLAKGPNRLVEALRAGRFAVAHSTPAYEEFKAWAWIGDLAEGIEWALKHPAEVTKRIAAAQAHIERHFSPSAIGAEWEKAFTAAARLRQSGMRPSS